MKLNSVWILMKKHKIMGVFATQKEAEKTQATITREEVTKIAPQDTTDFNTMMNKYAEIYTSMHIDQHTIIGLAEKK